jgi:hypothetical protein
LRGRWRSNASVQNGSADCESFIPLRQNRILQAGRRVARHECPVPGSTRRTLTKLRHSTLVVEQPSVLATIVLVVSILSRRAVEAHPRFVGCCRFAWGKDPQRVTKEPRTRALQMLPRRRDPRRNRSVRIHGRGRSRPRNRYAIAPGRNAWRTTQQLHSGPIL